MGITTLQVVDVAYGSIANPGFESKPSAFVCLQQTPSPQGRNSLELVMGITTLQVVDVAYGSIANPRVRVKAFGFCLLAANSITTGKKFFGAGDGTRTHDLSITNRMHYRLCYTSKF